MNAKNIRFGPVSVLNEGQVAGLPDCRRRLFLCLPSIDKRSCTPWANCNGMSKPFKRRIPQGQTRPLFYFTKFFKGMVSVENIRTQGKHSTQDPTSESRNDSSSITLRNDELLQKIDDYFDYSGVAEPIETLGVLLDAFVATGDSDEPGYTPTFLRDVSWEVTRLSAFLAYLYEQRNFMVQSVKVKGGNNG